MFRHFVVLIFVYNIFNVFHQMIQQEVVEADSLVSFFLMAYQATWVI